MEIIKKISALTQKYPRPVVALGMFDGVHLGHAEVIGRAVEIAKKIDGTAMVFTFSNHPLTILDEKSAPLMIGSRSLRREIFSELGIKILIEIPFTKEFSKKTPEEFLDLLREKISPAYVVTGPNYTFGRFGKGNGRVLIREGENYGFKAEICPAVTVEKKIVSSTKIRALIAEGNLAAANELLGRNFTYVSEVVHGDKRGRKLGFPTANLEIADNRAMLPNGAYIVLVKVRGKIFSGIANIGDNPTFKVAKRRLEIFIDDFNAEIYGEEISVSFIEKLRDEKTFSSVDELKKQLRDDLSTMRNFLRV
ncbi:MAG: bifunctional riboflavin kinase/FAD synthetase [Selenomonadaceae bacterium]|nr:bifunctional riboflavin kinase/FAD synthetase [Selenomonadaceae bacterium]